MNSTVVILCLVGGILSFGLFLSYLSGMGKAFKPAPSTSSIQATKLKAQQHETAEDAQAKQRQLMDDMKQKMLDNSRRF